jgi:succinate-semialdehyde dehydrogenase/glutarate-semialdehyde dehydrogenase
VKKLSLELGGNAPLIVFDDADIDAALTEILEGKFRNAGQVCVSPNRIFVQSGIYDDFVARLAAAASDLRVGPFDEEGVQVGPLIDADAVAKVESHIADACERGARVIVGGERHARGGTFFEPTVVADATTEMLAMQDETFGPMATLLRFETEEEVLRMANETAYGLSAYVFTSDMNRFWRMIEGLETGIVGVNTAIISTESAPFGGIKESGLGREGSYYGIEDWLEVKYVCVGRVKTAGGMS